MNRVRPKRPGRIGGSAGRTTGISASHDIRFGARWHTRQRIRARPGAPRSATAGTRAQEQNASGEFEAAHPSFGKYLEGDIQMQAGIEERRTRPKELRTLTWCLPQSHRVG